MLPARFLADGRMKEVYIEKCVLQALQHASVIRYFNSFKSQNKLYLLVEFCPGGSLSGFLERHKTLSVPLARHFTAEIIDSLEYLRSKEIVHRDLKPGNVVLQKDYHVKLIDFATCKIFNKKLLDEIV